MKSLITLVVIVQMIVTPSLAISAEGYSQGKIEDTHIFEKTSKYPIGLVDWFLLRNQDEVDRSNSAFTYDLWDLDTEFAVDAQSDRTNIKELAKQYHKDDSFIHQTFRGPKLNNRRGNTHWYFRVLTGLFMQSAYKTLGGQPEEVRAYLNKIDNTDFSKMTPDQIMKFKARYFPFPFKTPLSQIKIHSMRADILAPFIQSITVPVHESKLLHFYESPIGSKNDIQCKNNSNDPMGLRSYYPKVQQYRVKIKKLKSDLEIEQATHTSAIRKLQTLRTGMKKAVLPSVLRQDMLYDPCTGLQWEKRGLDSVKACISQLETYRDADKNRIADDQIKIQDLEIRIGDLNRQLLEVQKEVEELEKMISTKKQDYEAAEAQLGDVAEDYRKLRQSITDAEAYALIIDTSQQFFEALTALDGLQQNNIEPKKAYFSKKTKEWDITFDYVKNKLKYAPVTKFDGTNVVKLLTRDDLLKLAKVDLTNLKTEALKDVDRIKKKITQQQNKEPGIQQKLTAVGQKVRELSVYIKSTYPVEKKRLDLLVTQKENLLASSGQELGTITDKIMPEVERIEGYNKKLREERQLRKDLEDNIAENSRIELALNKKIATLEGQILVAKNEAVQAVLKMTKKDNEVPVPNRANGSSKTSIVDYVGITDLFVLAGLDQDEFPDGDFRKSRYGWFLEPDCERRKIYDGEASMGVYIARRKAYSDPLYNEYTPKYGGDWGICQLNGLAYSNVLEAGILLDLPSNIDVCTNILKSYYDTLSNDWNTTLKSGLRADSEDCAKLNRRTQIKAGSDRVIEAKEVDEYALSLNKHFAAYSMWNGGPRRACRMFGNTAYVKHDVDFRRVFESILNFERSPYDKYLPDEETYANSEHLLEREAIKALTSEFKKVSIKAEATALTSRSKVVEAKENFIASMEKLFRVLAYDYNRLIKEYDSGKITLMETLTKAKGFSKAKLDFNVGDTPRVFLDSLPVYSSPKVASVNEVGRVFFGDEVQIKASFPDVGWVQIEPIDAFKNASEFYWVEMSKLEIDTPTRFVSIDKTRSVFDMVADKDQCQNPSLGTLNININRNGTAYNAETDINSNAYALYGNGSFSNPGSNKVVGKLKQSKDGKVLTPYIICEKVVESGDWSKWTPSTSDRSGDHAQYRAFKVLPVKVIQNNEGEDIYFPIDGANSMGYSLVWYKSSSKPRLMDTGKAIDIYTLKLK